MSGLVKVSRHTWGININSVASPMSEIVRSAMATGEIQIAFGIPQYCDSDEPPYTIFEDTGPLSFAIDTLLLEAEAKGFDGDSDVAHRLEEGSELEYKTPLCSYVCNIILIK